MRALFLFPVLILLAGCNSLTRVGGDGFEASSVPPGRFEIDTQACGMQADDYLAYDLRGMEGTRYQRNRTYNAIYGRCMTARGYQPRPYIKNLLQD
jgi:hypothetical protein